MVMEAEQILRLVPKDKYDTEPIPELMKISEDEIRPILPNLLLLMADMNWPIARDIISVLAKFPDSVVPLIKEKLQPTEADEDWKYFIITDLIPKLPKEAQKTLIEDIERIITKPTDGEIYSEVWDMAKMYKESM